MADKIDFSSTYNIVKNILQNRGVSVSANSLADIITELVAGLNTFDNYKLSKVKSSLMFKNSTDLEFVVSLARSLYGYSPKRKTSARVSCRLTQTPQDHSIIIPKYSKFTINNNSFVNYNDIVIAVGDNEVDFELVQGEVQTEYFSISDKSKIKLSLGNWEIADDSVITDLGLKKFKNFIDFNSLKTLEQVDNESEVGAVATEDIGAYIDYTDYQGYTNLEFMLIDTLKTQSIAVKYLKTKGTEVEVNTIGLPVVLNGSTVGALAQDYKIETTSPITGGSDQDSIEDIKLKSFQNLSLNKKSLCTYNEYLAYLKEYPGVKLCNIWNEQTELANQSSSAILMNRYFYTIIFNTFYKFIESKVLNTDQIMTIENLQKGSSIIPGYFRIYPQSITLDEENTVIKDAGNGILYTEFIPNIDTSSTEIKFEFSHPDKINPIHPLSNMLDPSQDTYFESESPALTLSTFTLECKFEASWLAQHKINLIRFRYPNLKDFPTQNNLNSVKVYTLDTTTGESSLISLPKYFDTNSGVSYSDWIVLKETLDGSKSSNLSISFTNTYYDTSNKLNPIRISNIEFGYADPETNYINYSTNTYKQSYINNKLVNVLVGAQIKPENLDSKIKDYFKDVKEMLVDFIARDPVVRLVDFDIVVFLKNTSVSQEIIRSKLENIISDYLIRYNKIDIIELNNLFDQDSVLTENCKLIKIELPSSNLESLELNFYMLGSLVINFK